MPLMKLVNAQGQPGYGVIDTPVRVVNYQDFELKTPMDRKVSRFRKEMRFNQFQFIGLMSEAFIVGVAIVDLKWVSNCFVYVYDRVTKQRQEHNFIHPVALGTKMTLQPDNGEALFVHAGSRASICAGKDPSTGQPYREVRVNIKAGLKLDVKIQGNSLFTPLRVCSRAGYDGWVYTQKAAGLFAEGRLETKDKQWAITPDKVLASYDWSAGFMRRETCWNWACFAGRLEDGRTLGLNLAAGVNETGVTENAFWLDGKMIKLGAAMFEFDRDQPGRPWRVTTSDGRLDLSFVPEGMRTEKMNAVFIASNFKQMFGVFNGTYKDDSGELLAIECVPGFMEDHYAKW
jgi:hypothetical protein